MPVLVTAGGKKWPTYALLDTGANCSAIIEDICTNIDAPVKNLEIKLGVFGHESTKYRAVTSVVVSNLNEDFEISLQNALVEDYISKEYEIPTKAEELQKFEHLKDVEFNDLEDSTVGILLDAKFAWAFFAGQVRAGADGDPIAVESKFGWALMGPKFEQNFENNSTASVCLVDSDEDTLREEIRRMFRHDFIGVENELYSSEEVHMSANDEWSFE